MTYAKTSLFVDVDNKMILDWDLVMSRKYDSKIAQGIFKGNALKNISCLGDKGYDSEPLHEITRKNGIDFFAPVRKMDKRGSRSKRPKGFFRRNARRILKKERGLKLLC